MLKEKKSRKEVANPYYSLGLMRLHHDLSIVYQAKATLGVSYKQINQRLLSYQCILDSGCVYYPVKRASLVP